MFEEDWIGLRKEDCIWIQFMNLYTVHPELGSRTRTAFTSMAITTTPANSKCKWTKQVSIYIAQANSQDRLRAHTLT